MNKNKSRTFQKTSWLTAKMNGINLSSLRSLMLRRKVRDKFIIGLFFLFVFSFLGIIIFSSAVQAQSQYNYTPLESVPGFSGANDFPSFVLAIYKFGIWTVGIAALLMITIGGFMYMTSAGNMSKNSVAKDIIRDALIGLVIALVAYLILYVINPDLVRINLTLKPAGTSTGIGSTAPTATGGKLAVGCNNYAAAFSSAAGGDKNLECLLIAIANNESSCDPNKISPVGSCGLMQMQPGTAGVSCADLVSNPNNSIQLAKQYLASAKSNIQNHAGFDIGSSNNLSGKVITYGSFVYDTGNDDLIASYNAGSGKTATTANKKGPFEVSSDCPSPVTPAWQCNINPGGFAETQTYVMRVQQSQRQCLAGK